MQLIFIVNVGNTLLSSVLTFPIFGNIKLLILLVKNISKIF